jgi:anaerobic magnesium-protoporphyrin IX monomethyl ester cyclase
MTIGERVTVIVPPVVCHNLDPHTGIPFMPHMAAHVAGSLYQEKFDVQVIDSFGLQPNNRVLLDEFMLLGVDEDWIVKNIRPATKIAYIYCRTMAEFLPITRLCRKIRERRPEVKIGLFENIQSVTSFSLLEISDELLSSGADVLLLGEPERRIKAVSEILISGSPCAEFNSIPGLVWSGANNQRKQTQREEFDKDLDTLPLPLWERFPLEGYWRAGYAHAPNTDFKFLPILTSRGCPFRCTFCISPSLNPTWRGRSAKSVADEMEYFYHRLGVKEFHVSDLDPTVSDKRTRAICEELIGRHLPIKWKLAQGTKIETIKSEETLELMKRAGVSFVAFSPESGSTRMLKIMNKPFNHEHGVRMVKKMNDLGIHTQACFIGGVPGETSADRDESVEYVKRLMDAGLDELAVYIFAPIPGAELSKSLTGFSNFSQCTFSPTWRNDYKEVNRYRLRMYATYFARLLRKPNKLVARTVGFLTGAHKTKMEMSVKKQMKLWLLRFVPQIYSKLNPEEELHKAQNREIKW